jgi:release factor glutamine methyltransferase
LSRAHEPYADAVAFLRAAGCLYAEEEARVLAEAAGSLDELKPLLERRAAGEPIEHIVGWAEFRGLRIPVSTGVFVPRRRSEFLVECAVQAVRSVRTRAKADPRPVKVLDMCCGSGAIGLCVAIESGDVDLIAADCSPLAVECARKNLASVGGSVYLGDLFGPLPQSELHGFDVIVANAPYVPTGEIPTLPAEARLHEPIAALDGGPDGTSVQGAILAGAADWLRRPGLCLIETSSRMSSRTALIARDNGFAVEVRESPELDATVVVATRG